MDLIIWCVSLWYVGNFSLSTISLWDESAEAITENDFKEDGGPYIIIVTSTTVKAFQGTER